MDVTNLTFPQVGDRDPLDVIRENRNNPGVQAVCKHLRSLAVENSAAAQAASAKGDTGFASHFLNGSAAGARELAETLADIIFAKEGGGGTNG